MKDVGRYFGLKFLMGVKILRFRLAKYILSSLCGGLPSGQRRDLIL